jgi:hypothetical protein
MSEISVITPVVAMVDEVDDGQISVCGFTPRKGMYYSDYILYYIKSGQLKSTLEKRFGSGFYIKSLIEKEDFADTYQELVISMQYTLFAVVYSEHHRKHFCVVIGDEVDTLLDPCDVNFEGCSIFASNSHKGYKVWNYKRLHEYYTLVEGPL